MRTRMKPAGECFFAPRVFLDGQAICVNEQTNAAAACPFRFG